MVGAKTRGSGFKVEGLVLELARTKGVSLLAAPGLSGRMSPFLQLSGLNLVIG